MPFKNKSKLFPTAECVPKYNPPPKSGNVGEHSPRIKKTLNVRYRAPCPPRAYKTNNGSKPEVPKKKGFDPKHEGNVVPRPCPDVFRPPPCKDYKFSNTINANGNNSVSLTSNNTIPHVELMKNPFSGKGKGKGKGKSSTAGVWASPPEPEPARDGRVSAPPTSPYAGNMKNERKTLQLIEKVVDTTHFHINDLKKEWPIPEKK